MNMTGDYKYDYAQAYDDGLAQGMSPDVAEQHALDICGDFYTDDVDEYGDVLPRHDDE